MATKYTFEYIPQPSLDSSGKLVDVYRPYVPIRLEYGHKIDNPFYALVDSGSDRNLLPAAFGVVLGINIRKGKPRDITGIGQHALKAYTHQVGFFLGARKFKTEVDFSYEQTIPLLGRTGFFDLFYSINFNEKKRKLELMI
ncbi:MAG: hypothetical protein HY376_00455 [Candidatus Blackburnbacteria bacterium]|nr:hypothetical protein [Candidatus Blackburnbacteria bacterium]